MEQSTQKDERLRHEEELMTEIVTTKEKIAQKERDIKASERAIKQIEQSRTWKFGRMFRFFNKLFRSEAKEQLLAERNRLREKLVEKNEQLITLREETEAMRLLDERTNKYRITETIRALKQSGELLPYIDRVVTDKEQIDENYKEALTYAARLYMNEEEPYKRAIYEKIFAGLSIEQIPELMIRIGLVDEAVPLVNASSFRASLSMRMRKKQLHDHLPEFALDDKRTAYDFAKVLQLNVPKIDETIYDVAHLPEKTGVAIKPADAAGARGVYLVHDVDDIYDVRHAKKLTSYQMLVEAMQKDLVTGAVAADEWIVEELIYENRTLKTPARDIKFYAFYGKVGLVLEIVRDPELRQCWWLRDGTRITTGKYDDQLFVGSGVTEAEIQLAEKVSAQIPAPFIRIDFLRSEDGLVFGEFTPKPGNYDDFDQKTDQLLGDYFLEAEGRLTNDLLNGKQFESFQQFIRETERLNV